MNRRSFLGSVALGAIGWSGLALTGCAAAGGGGRGDEPEAAAKNWIWTGIDSKRTPDEQRERFRRFRGAGIGGVLFSGSDESVFALAREEGLEAHAWIWTLCRGGEFLRENHPEWYAVSREGDSTLQRPPYVGYYRFLCPSREPVRAYLEGIVSDLADLPWLDGVHLDYVRYPDVILPRALWKKYDLVQDDELPEFDFCYCEVCRAAFRAIAGVDPLELPDPPRDGRWRQYRYDSVTDLVNRLAGAVHARQKKITAAVFPTPSIARKLVRQDWVRWNLDAVFPMVYHSFYEKPVAWIEEAVGEGVAALPASRPLYAGLYLPAIAEGDEFEAAVRHARAGGARGVSLFGGLRRIGAG